MNKKLYIFSLIFSILLFQSVLGLSSDFNVDVIPIDTQISANETALLHINITNKMSREAQFLVYSGDFEWDLVTIPYGDKNIILKPNQSKLVVINIKPKIDLWPNYYGTSVKIKNDLTKEVLKKDILIDIRGESTEIIGEHLPAIFSRLEVKSLIDPREEFEIKLILTNQNRLKNEQVYIQLKSVLFEKEYETNLDGYQTKTLPFKIKLDPLTRPQKNILNAKITIITNTTQYQFYANSEEYEIIGYANIEEYETEVEKVFKKSNSITLKNIGNIEKEFRYEIPKYFGDILFFSSDSIPNLEILNGEKKYVWKGQLSPLEEFDINYTRNYRSLIYLTFLIIAIYVFYIVTRSPVLLVKNAKIIGKAEGGITEFGIYLHVKNRSNKKIHSLEIRDKVPNLFRVKSEFKLGTLQPTKVLSHEKKGTIIKYEIDELDPFEERIICYKVRARFSILGDFSLPRAGMKYKRHKLKSYEYYHSNIFRMEYNESNE
jgi:hypothetical protein